MKSKLQFFEVVQVVSDDPIYAEINGQKGAILGMSKNEDGDWGYAVHLFEIADGWAVPGTSLVSLGKFMKREDFYEGSSIKVGVDIETGEGHLLEE